MNDAPFAHTIAVLSPDVLDAAVTANALLVRTEGRVYGDSLAVTMAASELLAQSLMTLAPVVAARVEDIMAECHDEAMDAYDVAGLITDMLLERSEF